MTDQLILPPQQLHTTTSCEMRREVIPVKNREEMIFLKKPAWGTGLWTSSWKEEKGSDWVEYCHGQGDYSTLTPPDERYWHILTPKPDARLCVINSRQDLDQMVRAYPWRPSMETLTRTLVTSRSGNIIVSSALSLFTSAPYSTAIDFERMSQDYDGIWLTEQGFDETYPPLLSSVPDLSHWSCESTLWFHWCFDTVTCVKTPVINK